LTLAAVGGRLRALGVAEVEARHAHPAAGTSHRRTTKRGTATLRAALRTTARPG
jgi:hypothetical protein